LHEIEKAVAPVDPNESTEPSPFQSGSCNAIRRFYMTSGHARQDEEWSGIKDDVGGLAAAALDRGRDFVDSARQQASGYAEQRKDDLAQSVADFAESLRSSTATFEDRPNIRAVVDTAAEGLDQLAGSIRDRSYGEIYAEVEDVMRRRPLTVFATSLALGFLAARFVKSSSENLRDQNELYYADETVDRDHNRPRRQQPARSGKTA
jgi:hypothetical protein